MVLKRRNNIEAPEHLARIFTVSHCKYLIARSHQIVVDVFIAIQIWRGNRFYRAVETQFPKQLSLRVNGINIFPGSNNNIIILTVIVKIGVGHNRHIITGAIGPETARA
ncbi:hypothetical protein BMS3Bbin16_01095 [archaeon BMS3Bbin16]|nr:hypothetical protein BMS3Bbin16_01095 [archaeon BMS3Bbin16]